MAPDDVSFGDTSSHDMSFGDTSSHDMSLDDMSLFGPSKISLWALHFEWAKSLKTKGLLIDPVYKDVIL